MMLISTAQYSIFRITFCWTILVSTILLSTMLLDFRGGLVYSSVRRSGAPAESQRSKGDAVVRQSYLGFLEATLALMVAASLTYAQTTSGLVAGILADATGAFVTNAQVTTFCKVPRSKVWGFVGTHFEGPDRPTESSGPVEALTAFHREEQ
jgi:hypothetical protein